jgi:general stress protein 26
LDQKGEPNIHPTWYYFDNNNDKLYIESGKESKKTQNVRRNNILYYCIDDDNIPYKGVRGKGIVRVSEDVDYNLQIVERIVVKYLGSTEHPVSHTIIDSIRNKEAYHTRDNTKILCHVGPWQSKKNRRTEYFGI